MADVKIPVATDYEITVVGACCSKAGAESYMETKLEKEHFYDQRCAIVFETARDMVLRAADITASSLTAEIGEKNLESLFAPNGIAYFIFECEERGFVCFAAESVASNIIDAYIRRKKLEQMQLWISVCTTNQSPKARKDADATFLDSFLKLCEAQPAVRSKPFSDFSDCVAEMLHPDKPKEFAVSSGFDLVDNLLEGGYKKDTLTIVAARPGVGKTAFMQHIVHEAGFTRQRCSALLISIEMGVKALAPRLFAHEARVPIAKIKQRDLSDRDLDMITATHKEVNASILRYWDKRPCSISDISKMVAQAKRSEHGLDLLIVDYLQLVEPSRRHNMREREIAEISSTLVTLARNHDIAVVALAQLNRNIDTRGAVAEPKLADLRDSGQIEQDADVVILLSRDGEKSALIDVAKNRNGRTGKVICEYQGEFFRFKEKGMK